ncbi:MAG: extracellular solute-binding protein [Lentisphaerae bacterium]|nr:extracellular solute-binding protein [Lentisphaerota bacterium]
MKVDRQPLLRRQSRSDTICRHIREQVREGQLRPGDRVESINRLAELYGASRRAVVHALKTLEAEAILLARPGSGFYVETEASDRLEEQAHAAAVPREGRPRSQTRSLRRYPEFLFPKPASAVPSVYVSELFGPSVRLWDSILSEYGEMKHAPRPRMFSCRDGHLEDLWGSERPDVVVTTPHMIDHLGREHFRDRPDLSVLDAADAVFPPAVRHFLEHDSCPGIPFSITIPHLYVNEDLLEQTVPSQPDPTGVEDLLSFCGKNRDVLERVGVAGLALSSLLPFLFLEGGVRRMPGGSFVVDEGRTRACLAALPGAAAKLDWDPESLFLQGKSVFLYQGSFLVDQLREQAQFRWRVLPLPPTRGGWVECWLMVLAVRRDTSCPAEALSLAKYLLSDAVQRKLGRMGRNAPVREDAAFSPDVLDAMPLDEPALRSVLKAAVFVDAGRTPDRLGNEFMEASRAVIDGRDEMDKVLGILRFLLSGSAGSPSTE